MDDTNQPAGGDPAAVHEADDIVRNKDNPDYKAYWNNNRAVVDRVNALYQKGIPGEKEIGSGSELPEKLSLALDDYSRPRTGQPQAQSPQQQTPQQQGGGPIKFSEAWDYSEAQAKAALEKQWGYWHPEYMSEVQNPENFGLVFGDFIKSEDDKRFLGELFQMVGNHPGGLRLYHHLIQKLKGGV